MQVEQPIPQPYERLICMAEEELSRLEPIYNEVRPIVESNLEKIRSSEFLQRIVRLKAYADEYEDAKNSRFLGVCIGGMCCIPIGIDFLALLKEYILNNPINTRFESVIGVLAGLGSCIVVYAVYTSNKKLKNLQEKIDSEFGLKDIGPKVDKINEIYKKIEKYVPIEPFQSLQNNLI